MHTYDTLRGEGYLQTPAAQFTLGSVILKSILWRYFMCSKTHQPQADRSLCLRKADLSVATPVGKSPSAAHGPRAFPSRPQTAAALRFLSARHPSWAHTESQSVPSCLASAISLKRSLLLPSSQASLCEASIHHSPADRGVGLRLRGSHGRCVFSVVKLPDLCPGGHSAVVPAVTCQRSGLWWRSHCHSLMTRRTSVHLLNILENACSNVPVFSD